MISEPKLQKGLQNDQKSIRFIDKTHMAFRHVEKPYKPVENTGILEAQTSESHTMGPPSILHSSFFILHSSFNEEWRMKNGILHSSLNEEFINGDEAFVDENLEKHL